MIPSYKPPDEVTIEAFAGGQRIEATITFKDRVRPSEFSNIKVAFEAGLREGLLLASRVVSDTGSERDK